MSVRNKNVINILHLIYGFCFSVKTYVFRTYYNI